jgi:hypothetical protein
MKFTTRTIFQVSHKCNLEFSQLLPLSRATRFLSSQRNPHTHEVVTSNYSGTKSLAITNLLCICNWHFISITACDTWTPGAPHQVLLVMQSLPSWPADWILSSLISAITISVPTYISRTAIVPCPSCSWQCPTKTEYSSLWHHRTEEAELWDDKVWLCIQVHHIPAHMDLDSLFISLCLNILIWSQQFLLRGCCQE